MIEHEPPYERLIELLARDWEIEASWDGLRRIWYIGLNEKGMRDRDERDATLGSHGMEWDGKTLVLTLPRDPERVCVRLFASKLAPRRVYAPDATLGRGECHDVCASVSEFTCSACGFNCDLTSWISLFDGDEGRHRHHHHGTPNFCPNCGARVIGGNT